MTILGSTDAVSLIRGKLGELGEEARTRGVSLSLHAPESAVVATDPKMLRCILRGLLWNALQNIPSGGGAIVSLTTGAVTGTVRF